MNVVSLVAQSLFLLAAFVISARVTIRSRSIAAGGLRLYGFFILWAILFCVVVPAVFTGLTGRSEVIAAFPDAIGVVPVICLSWIHAFAFAGLVRLIHWGMTRWAGAGRVPRFEDYNIQTGYMNVGHLPHASIEEFFSLAATGSTPEEAVENLRKRFEERVNLMMESGERIPRPGSGRARPRFAPNDQIEVLRPFVDEFWSEILGTSYLTSFVSNESRLSSWEHYVSGGRPALIQKVKERYGVDITAFYDDPIPDVLGRVQEGRSHEKRH